MSGPQAQLSPETKSIPAAGQPALLELAIRLALVLSILIVYAQVRHFDFVDYDDTAYVSQNRHVQEGLTAENFKWAFTAIVSSNWMPVTLLSHMLDVQLFGLHSGMHHLVNVVFHILAALLLYAMLQRATRATGCSAFVALVFALHPLHVGSVAWVAERKDVLSAFFFFLALYCYVRYTEEPSPARYLSVVASFCLGLMSKPMLVTFPFLLLLLDLWPLQRLRWPNPAPKIFREKLPLFALSAAASGVTYWAQKSTGAVQLIPFGMRLKNALVSYVIYLGQTFWPARLAVFYPYPREIAVWHAVAALTLILVLSIPAILAWQKRPYLTIGWFWYLGTLVPVVGLVQVGQQPHADRYTYLPIVGLTVMLAWGAAEVAGKWPKSKPVIAATAILVCALLMGDAWKQVSYWQNTETLFEHALEVTDNNWMVQTYLAMHLVRLPGRRGDAVEHFGEALRINPDYVEANNDLGWCLADAGLCGAAIPHFEAALRIKPDMAEARDNLGRCLVSGGQYDAAIGQFEAAVRIQPDNPAFHFELGQALEKAPGRTSEAIREYQAVLRLSPNAVAADHSLGMLLAGLGRTQEALAHLEAAQQLRPDPERSKTIDRLRSGRQ